MAGAITPIMLATGLATALIYLQTTQTITDERLFAENLRADAVLSSAIGGIEDGLADSVASLPEVGGVSAFVASSGYFPASYESEDGDERDAVPVQGVTVDGTEPAIAISPTAGTLSDLRGDTVALSTHHADRLGHQVGDTMRMRLGDRAEVELEVVALFPARRGYETVLLPASLVAQHTTAGLIQEILVRAVPDTDQAQLVTALEELASQRPGLTVADRDDVLAAQAEQEQIRVWVNYLLVAMIVGYTVIALVNTLIIATGERRREFALQRLIGSTRGLIVRMMGVEALLVAIGGVVVGTAVAATTLVPFGIAAAGSPVPRGPLWIYLAVIGGATLLALASTLLSTLVALRYRPVEAAANL